jgi:hypothetical protein
MQCVKSVRTNLRGIQGQKMPAGNGLATPGLQKPKDDKT